MDIILGVLGIGLVIMLLRTMFKTNHEPEYMLIPVPVQHQQQSIGCLPIVMFLVLGILMLVLLRGSY